MGVEWMDSPESRAKHRAQQQILGEDAHRISNRLESDPLMASGVRFDGFAQSYEILVVVDERRYRLKMEPL